MDDDDHGLEARSSRPESSSIFVDQQEELLMRSTASTSPGINPSRSSSLNEIGDPQDPIIVDDDEQYEESIANSQQDNGPSSSGHGHEEGDADGEEFDESDVVDVQEPLQEAHQTDQGDSNHGSGVDPSSDVEGDAVHDSDADAQDDNSPTALIRLAQSGGTNCQLCRVFSRLVERQQARFKQTVKKMNGQILEYKQQIQDLQEEIREMKRKIDPSGPSDGKPRPMPTGPKRQGVPVRKTWHSLLREAVVTPFNGVAWTATQRMCAREENYSLKTLHPHIRLVGTDDSDSESDDDTDIVDGGRSREATTVAPSMPFGRFQRAFPDNILMQILRTLLFFEGQLVFVFNRLDPFARPGSFPEEDSGELADSSGLKGRFYISGEIPCEISLTYDTISPGMLLAPLCVSRKWNYYGVSQFYGSNTFAFSSFGEFDKFCIGIGPARVQRIGNLELNWVGSNSVRWEDAENPSNRLDSRVAPLAWLSEMKRVQTLCIFIDESSKRAVRRPNEPEDFKKYAKQMTAGQPNARMYRSIRGSRGMDWVFNLRGLSFVRLYDTTKMLATNNRKKSLVRDKSAQKDINRTTKMAKTPTRASQAELPKLEPLFRRVAGKWEPGREDFLLVEQMYNQSGPSKLRKNKRDIDCDPRRGTPPVPDDNPDDENGSDVSGDSSSDSSSSSSDSDSPRRPQGPLTPTSVARDEFRARRGPTPGFVLGEEISDPSGDEEVETAEGHGEDGDDEAGGGATASESVELVRMQRTDEFVRSLQRLDNSVGLIAEPPAGVNRSLRRTKSPGAVSKVSHISDQLHTVSKFHSNSQDPIQIDDNDDEDCKIISRPATGTSFVQRFRSRSGTARRSNSSGLFCTPGPDESKIVKWKKENSTAGSSTGGSPSASASVRYRAASAESAHIDLTLDDDDNDSDLDLLDDTPRRQAGPSPSPSHQKQQLARKQSDPPRSPQQEELSRMEAGAEEMSRAARAARARDRLGPPGGGRTGSSSPQPRGVKRTRDSSSVANTDPGEGYTKRSKPSVFGSHSDWIWPVRRQDD